MLNKVEIEFSKDSLATQSQVIPFSIRKDVYKGRLSNNQYNQMKTDIRLTVIWEVYAV